jgi:hypothetical protein
MDTSQSQEFLNLQSKLLGLSLAIKFKTYLLELEVQSRRHLLDYCVQWIELKKDRENDLYAWFQNAQNVYMNDDEESKKTQLSSWQMWDDLYLNLSGSVSFQNLVSFFVR